jgi:hypothetical protein
MSDREQIDGFEGLRRRHSEGRSFGGSMTRADSGYNRSLREGARRGRAWVRSKRLVIWKNDGLLRL